VIGDKYKIARYCNEGFIDAEKIKIYPLFHVAKIWEKPRVYNKEI